MFIPDITVLVPHAKPMLLVDKLVRADQNSLCSEVTIGKYTLFCHEDGVDAWIGIEYMAQTVAAHAGFLAHRKNEPVRIGFLLGTRHYQCQVNIFPFGATLQIQVERQYLSEDGLGSYECRIFAQDQELAHAILTVYQTSEAQPQTREL